MDSLHPSFRQVILKYVVVQKRCPISTVNARNCLPIRCMVVKSSPSQNMRTYMYSNMKLGRKHTVYACTRVGKSFDRTVQQSVVSALLYRDAFSECGRSSIVNATSAYCTVVPHTRLPIWSCAAAKTGCLQLASK